MSWLLFETALGLYKGIQHPTRSTQGVAKGSRLLVMELEDTLASDSLHGFRVS